MAFHFSALYPGDNFATASARHEQYLFAQLRLRPGMRVLAVGCGSVRACIELLQYEQVYLVGIDEDEHNVRVAQESAARSGFVSRAEFVCLSPHACADYFGPASFDAVFSIEALKTASSFLDAYVPLATVLKLGGMMGLYEWCWTSSADPMFLDHIRLAEQLEHQTHISHRPLGDRTYQAAAASVERTQMLSLIETEDLAQRRSALSWYAPLLRGLATSSTRWASDSDCDGTFGALTRGGAAILARAGQLKLFTPMLLLVAQRV